MNCRASAGETRGYPGGSDEGVARSGSGLSYVLAYNSVDSESREPVLQHVMYYRLYHRSWFAGLGTCPCGLPQRVCATSPSVDPRGVFPGDLRVAESPR